MKINTTYECENCHKVFNTKEEAWMHEQDGECEHLENIYVKEIFLDVNHCNKGTFIIQCYPNAKYKKSNNTIQLCPNSTFYSKDKFPFEYCKRVMVDDCYLEDDLVIYTMNNDPKHERELINKLIDYKISDLNDKKEEIDKEIKEWNHSKDIFEIRRIENGDAYLIQNLSGENEE